MTFSTHTASLRTDSDSKADSASHYGQRELTIGEMASEFKVSLRTLRFYEDRKLLKPRREGNTRLYSATDRLRMEMILKGKQLGFTLTEIFELIGAYDTTDSIEDKLKPQQIVTQIDHLERQRSEIDEAIARLRATQERLAVAARGGSALGAKSQGGAPLAASA